MSRIRMSDKIPLHTKMRLYEPRQFALLYRGVLWLRVRD